MAEFDFSYVEAPWLARGYFNVTSLDSGGTREHFTAEHERRCQDEYIPVWLRILSLQRLVCYIRDK